MKIKVAYLDVRVVAFTRFFAGAEGAGEKLALFSSGK